MYVVVHRNWFVQTFNELLKEHMNEAEVLAMVSMSQEFEQIKVS